LWDGQFSVVKSNGFLIKFIQQCLPKNTVLVIPRCDGNITRTSVTNPIINWNTEIQPYIDYAKEENKIFLLGVLAQVYEEPDINYIYLPLDDNFFEQGVTNYFCNETFPTWKDRSSQLCWRGGCSGPNREESLRIRFVDKIYKNNSDTNVRLSHWWKKDMIIPNEYFADRIHYSEFFYYKIFFIIDGAVIASNHMYGFASGSVPFLISNSKCWFSHLIIPYVHYIPVDYDLSNLFEQIEWVKNNDEKAEIIAKNAVAFAATYFTAEYQQRYVKESIERYCIQGAGNGL
jgi:hypothetical protein